MAGECVIILAAGASTRFGSPKQLSPWQGTTLLRYVVQEALAVREDVRVALGANREAVAVSLAGLACRCVEVEAWRRGLGASIKAGLAVAPAAGGVLVTLGDLPRVDRHHFTRLLAEEGELVAAAFDGIVGAPAVFRGPFVDALRQLDDAVGARRILEAHRSRLLTVSMLEAGFDVDTPNQLVAAEL